MQASLYIIAAPSGGGKTSLIRELIDKMSGLQLSISHTTRAKRPGEKEGEDYFFVDEQQFERLSKQDFFLESATVFNASYGTSKQWVREQLQQGIGVILEIDWQGARQVRTIFPDCISIFILPPSLEVLEQRLLERAQDDLITIEQRMAAAHGEMEHYDEFDYLIINDEFATALSQLQAIVQCQRLLVPRQQQRYSELLSKLLKN